MITEILAIVSIWVIEVISSLGYTGIAVLMAVESSAIPIPSEVIMPFSGFLVWEEKLSLWGVVFWGAAGNLVGSLLSYSIGFFGGRPFLWKFGKFVLITRHDIDLADRWFQKYGTITIFASRMLPIVRTFISFPAGIARMNVWRFSLYTFAGSVIWSFILTYVGIIMGKNWTSLEGYFRKFDWVVVLALALLGALWAWKHVKEIQNSKAKIYE